jgi:hypothetical protein
MFKTLKLVGGFFFVVVVPGYIRERWTCYVCDVEMVDDEMVFFSTLRVSCSRGRLKRLAANL